MDFSNFNAFVSPLIEISYQAGVLIMDYYGKDLNIDRKGDNSPVTAADRAAEAVILEGLSRLAPQFPVIAEESVSAGIVPPIERCFFLVDPLDGTREFIHGRDEFTVNIALIESGKPVFGLIYAPALGELYLTLSPDQAAETRLAPSAHKINPATLSFKDIKTRMPKKDGLTVVTSRSHLDKETENFLKNHRVTSRATAGSSIKFCLLARGEADLYPRFGRTMEWDTAAGHAILEAAGGRVLNLDHSPFLYGKEGDAYANPGFVAWGCASYEPSSI